ncbi:MAG: bifunctional UDP-sugar hydrolase/5'-nucleotidase [Deltaproteobacteria bacterium]|nr:bifunctional UDP-sugar hydrolase/5'-nucleotidase [Deltaproteobacteria bacterium]
MKKITALAFSLLLIIVFADSEAAAGNKEKELVILFTHDLHSYFLPHRILTAEEKQLQQGGYARLAFLIKEQKLMHQNKALLIDAGDFSMGTLFHTSSMQEASELRLMGKMGYDVVTFGNHDFDFHPDGLAMMLQSARSKSKQLPQLTASNIVFSKNDPGDATLKLAFQSYPVKEYTIIKRNGVSIGIFGIVGKNAADDAPFAKPLTFADPVRTSKRIVNILKKKEKVDIVICLSHSGTLPVKEYSEDEKLAREVPQIDVIISGHTHRILPQPIVTGKTIIVSSGRYGERLGVLKIVYTKGKDIKLASYELQNVTTGIPENMIIAKDITTYEDIVNRDFLSSYNLTFNQVIAESDFNMESLASAHAHPREMGLGNMITDAYRYAVQKAEGKNYEYVHFVLEPLGLIRDSFQKGKITVADVFQVLSLGRGIDGVAGYPLMAFYINGKELKDILEVDTSVAPLKKEDAHLQISGIKFKFNPRRILFDRVREVSVLNEKGDYEPLDSRKLYRVCSDLYTAGMIDYISGVTYGFLSIKPKDKDGRALPDIKQAIIYTDKNSSKATELKEWIALVQYLRSFKDTNKNGIPDIPEKYQKPEGRIQAEPSMNPVKLIAGGNAITYGALLIGLALLCAWIFLMWLVIRKIRSSGRIK